MNTYFVALELVLQAQERLGSFAWEEDRLRDICDKVERLSKEFEGDFVDVEVDKQHAQLILGFECEEIIVYQQPNLFAELAKNVSGVRFHCLQGNAVRVEFTLDGLWKKENR